MKVRVMVEIIESGRTVARRVRQTEVSAKTSKLYEMMAGDDAYGFVAEDVMSGAMKVVQAKAVADPTSFLSSRQTTDEQGNPTGRTELDEALGLDIIDNMLKKDGAGAQRSPGQVPGPPPLKVV